MRRPDRHLGFLLHDVARLLRQRFEQNARPLGLTRSQAQVVAHLALHQGIAQGRLAEILEIEPITLTRLVDGLERGGLVERHPHPRDRRIRRLFLTRKGQGLVERIFAVGEATRGEALLGVPEAERERLVDILSAMKGNLLARLGTVPGDAQAREGSEPERKKDHG